MKVLVLGGTRFFGIHLVDELLKSNCDVTIATRGLTSDSFGNKVERIRLDRHDELSIINNLSDKYFDVIYDNLAYCSNDIEILLPLSILSDFTSIKFIFLISPVPFVILSTLES